MKDESSYPVRRVLPLVLSYFFLLLVGCFDYVTGHEMHVGTLYLLVVATASWNLRPRQLVFHALATAVALERRGVPFRHSFLEGCGSCTGTPATTSAW